MKCNNIIELITTTPKKVLVKIRSEEFKQFQQNIHLINR